MGWLRQKLELSRGETTNLSSMEGLRGFAVFLAFMVHYSTLSTPWLSPSGNVLSFAQALHTVGNIGVDLFFVLSGYLIYGALIARPRSFWKFLGRRAQRIYPTFLAVLLIYIALSWVFPSESKFPREWIAAVIYLLQNVFLLPGLFNIKPVITVAWSLSYEMFYYVLIPIVISLLRLRAWSPGMRTLYFTGMTLVLAAYFAWQGGHVRLIMFISGILLWDLTQGMRLRGPGNIAALLGLCVALVALLLPGNGSVAAVYRSLLLFSAFFVLCFVCFTRPTEWIAQAFSWTPLRWLGNISYSYYLIHGLALKFMFIMLMRVLPPDHSETYLFPLLFLPAFALTIFPALALFLLVERPMSLKPASAKRGYVTTSVREDQVLSRPGD